MRIEVVCCKSRSTAARHCPWAAEIVKVYEGWIAFESTSDWETWKNQR